MTAKIKEVFTTRTNLAVIIAVAIIGVVLSVPSVRILGSSVIYWHINSQISEMEELAERLEQSGQRRDSVDAEIMELKEERKALIESDEVIAWCSTNGGTGFASWSRFYVLGGVLCAFVIGYILQSYAVWQLITKNEENTETPKRIEVTRNEKKANEFNGKAFITNLELLQQDFERTHRSRVDGATFIAKVTEIESYFDRMEN